jgi:hypothetical protein
MSGGGILAQIMHRLESGLVNTPNKADHKDAVKRWDPRIKEIRVNPVIKFRRFIIDLISTFEIKCGLNNVYSQGLYVWVKKGSALSK